MKILQVIAVIFHAQAKKVLYKEIIPDPSNGQSLCHDPDNCDLSFSDYIDFKHQVIERTPGIDQKEPGQNRRDPAKPGAGLQQAITLDAVKGDGPADSGSAQDPSDQYVEDLPCSCWHIRSPGQYSFPGTFPQDCRSYLPV